MASVLTACGMIQTVEPTDQVEVYRYTGSIQCQPGSGISLSHMQLILEREGISVYGARQGSDGRMRVAKCGAPSGQIYIFLIDADRQEQALALGWKKYNGPGR